MGPVVRSRLRSRVGLLQWSVVADCRTGEPPTQAAPYRQMAVRGAVRATVQGGGLSLEVGPRHVRLQLGPRLRLTASGQSAVVVRRGRRGERRRELDLRHSRLWLARSHPGRELALWFEVRAGLVERLGGVRPGRLLDTRMLDEWRSLDRFARQAHKALEPWAGGARSATELGQGGHRVLVVKNDERLVLYARPLFRERPRRVLEVCADGSLVIAGKDGDRRGVIHDRFGASVSGDRLLFLDRKERHVATVWLPWISLEDRRELSRRFGELVDPPRADREETALAEPERGMRVMRWASGIGRPSALSAFLPAPPLQSILGWRYRR